MEWEAKKLGIIIPTYDNLEMLVRLIRQIFDYTDFLTMDCRLIIIEDGQKLETVYFLRGLELTNPQVDIIYHSENKGVAPSWNDGLKKAEELGCDFFAFFNDDIEIYDGWWDEVLGMFKKGYNLVSTCRPRIGHEYLGGWFFIFDRETLDKVGYFDEKLAPFYQEDTDFIWRCEQKGIKSVLLDNPKLLHHESTTIEKNIKVNKPEFYEATIKKVNEHLNKKWKGIHR